MVTTMVCVLASHIDHSNSTFWTEIAEPLCVAESERGSFHGSFLIMFMTIPSFSLPMRHGKDRNLFNRNWIWKVLHCPRLPSFYFEG